MVDGKFSNENQFTEEILIFISFFPIPAEVDSEAAEALEDAAEAVADSEDADTNYML